MENMILSCVAKHDSLVCCSYSGNPYLRMDTRECNVKIVHKNKHTKLMVVLGIILFITLMVVDQVVKLRIKRKGVTTESSGAKEEPGQYKKCYNMIHTRSIMLLILVTVFSMNYNCRTLNAYGAKSNKVPCLH